MRQRWQCPLYTDARKQHKLPVHTLNDGMLWWHRISPTSSSGLQTSRFKIASAQHHHTTDHPSYTVADCQRPSFPNAHVYCATLHLLHSYEFSAAFSGLILSTVTSLTICTDCEFTCVIIGHFNRFNHLITNSHCPK